MLFHTLGQPFVAAVCLCTGVIAGVLFDVVKAAEIALGERKAMTAILDAGYSVLLFALLTAAFFWSNTLYVEWYMLPCVAAGGGLYAMGIRKPLLFCQRMIYNIRHQIQERKQSDGTGTRKDN